MRTQLKNSLAIFLCLFLFTCSSPKGLRVIYRSVFVKEYIAGELRYSGSDIEHIYIFIDDKYIESRMGIPRGIYTYEIKNDTIFVDDHKYTEDKSLVIKNSTKDTVLIFEYEDGFPAKNPSSFGKYYIDKKSKRVEDVMDFDKMPPEIQEYYREVKIR